MADSGGSAPEWKILEARPVTGGVARTVCIANQKGGVAKTTTTVNLAAGLALRGHRILVVDLDPQSNATTGLGIDHRAVERSTYDLLLGGASLAEVALPTAIDGLSVAPATVDLAGAEVELVAELMREARLRDALSDARGEYDLVFIDCPPSLGLLTINALVAADDLIVPVQCEYYALEGLGQLLDTAERVRRSLNPELRISGFLLTMFDARTNLATQVTNDVRSHFGSLVFENVIPRSVRLSEAPSFGEPVLTLDAGSRGSVAYRRLAAEVEARYGLDVHVPAPPPPQPPTPPVVSNPPGVHGRGYGVVTPVPPALVESWPPAPPWGPGTSEWGVRGGSDGLPKGNPDSASGGAMASFSAGKNKGSGLPVEAQ